MTHDKKYRLRVVVVMPEHVHLILTPLIDQARHSVVPLPEIMKAIKGASSHGINRRRGDRGALWLEESFDRIVRSSESLDAKIAYILENPVRRGLVSDWRDYPWIWRAAQPHAFAPSPKLFIPTED